MGKSTEPLKMRQYVTAETLTKKFSKKSVSVTFSITLLRDKVA